MSEKCYKGFNKGLVCKGKQYAENTVFEEDGGKICGSGVMHYCKAPMDVLEYYPLLDDNGDFNEFAEVEPLDEEQNDGNKFATKKLKIKAKFSFAGFVKACIDFVFEKTEIDKASSGNYAKLASSGNSAQLASSGDSAQLASSGNYAKLASSGNYAQLASSGNSAQLASSGDSAKITSTGANSVICCAGHGSIAKAKIGSFITLAEWERKEDGDWIPLNVETVKVDGVNIKEDTFYTMKNGKIVEAGDD